jgi:TnpA family transposase
MIDVIFGLDGGDLPEIVVTDTGSYSDVVFWLLELLGISCRPALADLPDQKGWRIKADAGYGPLMAVTSGRDEAADRVHPVLRGGVPLARAARHATGIRSRTGRYECRHHSRPTVVRA